MGGNSIEDDWDLPALPNNVRTVVLLGSAGNGKSATGNSILGRKVFESRSCPSGVTTTTEMQSTKLKDAGLVIDVIDTIGLFDPVVEPEVTRKEIIKCVDLAKDGLHAVLMVLSVRSRFTVEEATTLSILQTFFGPKITDYMIIVFTGGDELEENDQTLDDYLTGCPQPLKDILTICRDRRVLFDNKTKDKAIMGRQRQKLLDMVEMIMQENGGHPYTDSIFKKLQKGAMELRQREKDVDSLQASPQEIANLKEEILRSQESQLVRITEMVESKWIETMKVLEEQREITKKLEEQLAYERASLGKSKEEIKELRKELAEKGKCSIL